MKFGYARLSTRDQNLNLQIDDLLANGCEKIFQEAVNGANVAGPELNKLLEQTRRGDVIIIWKLERFGRSLKHMVALVNELLDKGAGLKSLNDPIDTTSSQEKLIFLIYLHLWRNLNAPLLLNVLKQVSKPRVHEVAKADDPEN